MEERRQQKVATTPLFYKRVGKSPHCIYALVHESYVNASSLAVGNQHKFPYQYCQCDIIFANYAQKVENKKRANRLMKNLCLRSVILKKYIHDKFNSFKEEVDTIIYGTLESTVFQPKLYVIYKGRYLNLRRTCMV